MDAARALKSLHKFKLHGKPITLAWAPGKGMKVILQPSITEIRPWTFYNNFFLSIRQWMIKGKVESAKIP